MRIPSGTTDQVIYFVALDSTDLKTRETGLTSFTVYRSKDGGASTAMTTPTVTEVDATNMAGVYKLLLDEDMTISSGNDSEEMIFHITQASMAPTDITIELYRPKITVGATSVAQTGDSYAVVNDGIFGNSALHDQIGNISGGGTGTGAVNASGATVTTGVETLTYTATEEQDGVVHEVADSGGNTDFYYSVTLGGNQGASEVAWRGYIQSNSDTVEVQYYNWLTTSYKTERVLIGSNSTTLIDETFPAISAYTGTGANLGQVRLRFLSTTTTSIATDRVRFVYSSNFQSVGYANGAVWIDTATGTAGTELYVNGVADNACLTLADANTIDSTLILDRFELSPDSSITFVASQENQIFNGKGYVVALGGQALTGSNIVGATVSGIATTTGDEIHFTNCEVGTCTLGASHLENCGLTSTLTLSEAATYTLQTCHSEIAGSASPIVDFGAAVGNTSLNMRRYSGGIEVQNMGTTGTDTMSLEGNGALTINANSVGGSIVLRGDFSVTGAVAFIAAGGTITYDDNTTDIKATLVDTNDLQTNQGNWLTVTGQATEAKQDIIDTNVDSILTDTGTTMPAQIAALNNITAASVLAAGDIDGFTLEEALKIGLAAMAGKASGLATTTAIYRAADDSKARITATVTAEGDRTAITLDGAG